MIEELELKHIVGYLPYKLQTKYQLNDISSLHPMETRNKELTSDNIDFVLIYCKLILHPLSGYRDINSKAMNDLNIDVSDQIKLNDFAHEDTLLDQVEHGIIQICYQNHIDFQDLIGNKLAIDINTLNK